LELIVGVILIFWAIFAFAGYYIGKDKNRAGEGLALGLFLGIIGVIIIACLKPNPEFGPLPPPWPDDVPLSDDAVALINERFKNR
jgi:hypothetical protein